MTIPTHQLIAAIESTIIRMPTRVGEWEWLDLPGVEGNMANNVTDAMVNNVGMSNLTEATADDAFARRRICCATSCSRLEPACRSRRSRWPATPRRRTGRGVD